MFFLLSPDSNPKVLRLETFMSPRLNHLVETIFQQNRFLLEILLVELFCFGLIVYILLNLNFLR